MSIKDKVSEKEQSIKQLLEVLRNNLNSKRIEFDKSVNNWDYLTTLSHTEIKLKELLKYFEI